MVHGERVIQTFGSAESASKFCMGYNFGWWAHEVEKQKEAAE